MLAGIYASPFQSVGIGREFIGHNHVYIIADVFFDVLGKCSRLYICRVKETEIAATLPNSDNRLFGFLASIDAPSDFLSAYLGFVHFDGTSKFLKWRFLSHRVPDAMTQIPRRPVVDSQHPFKLVCRHSLAGLAKQEHSKKPFRQGQVRIVEDRASRHGELIAA
jgi:hypothetical protein